MQTAQKNQSTESSSRMMSQPIKKEAAELREDFQALMEDVSSSVVNYCRKRPGVAGLCIFALGLYVGWKVKPW